MKILFDQGTPVPLRKALAEHSVETAFERGWQTLEMVNCLQKRKVTITKYSLQRTKIYDTSKILVSGILQ